VPGQKINLAPDPLIVGPCVKAIRELREPEEIGDALLAKFDGGRLRVEPGDGLNCGDLAGIVDIDECHAVPGDDADLPMSSFFCTVGWICHFVAGGQILVQALDEDFGRREGSFAVGLGPLPVKGSLG
jgi:hypothetical protein